MFTFEPGPDLLRDRVILVTGAGDGIGRAVAHACAGAGATVVLLGRTQHKLESLYDEIMQQGWPEPIIHPVDLGKFTEEDSHNLAMALEQNCGRLDGIVHNAAMLGSLTPIPLYKMALWDEVMHMNLKVPLLISRACIPLLRQAEDAAILFTSTDTREKSCAYWGAYGVSKAAIDALMHILADELENNTPIRVHGINPGAVRTRMRAVAYPGEDLNTLPTPDQVVPAYLYLLGGPARDWHGKLLHVQQPD
ncbi:MAG: YciK family oxidoreductase [Granulosicoccaceae bacterium]|jgi:NAD(P)-dependent dehydrogenase (short-subunit alcohol dehydrogenase family)